MKTSLIRVDIQNRRFVRDIYYGIEDGLPEGYTLYLEETVHPEDSTFYKNGDWGAYSYSPKTLSIKYKDKITILDTITTNGLKWLDIYKGIILYGTISGSYKDYVLYNPITKAKRTITAEDYIKFKEAWEDSFDGIRHPTLWVQDNIIYIYFMAVDGFYDGGEDVGSKTLYFNKDTLEQLRAEDCHLDGFLCDIIDEERGKDYGNFRSAISSINLYPDCFHNRYDIKDIMSIVHEVRHKEHKYKDCPKSIIKQMRKIRLAYAKENQLEITPYNIKPYRETIWHKLGKFFERLGDKVDNRRHKRLDRIRKKYKK